MRQLYLIFTIVLEELGLVIFDITFTIDDPDIEDVNSLNVYVDNDLLVGISPSYESSTLTNNSTTTITVSSLSQTNIGRVIATIFVSNQYGNYSYKNFIIEVNNNFDVISIKEASTINGIDYSGTLYVLNSYLNDDIEEIWYEQIKIENSTFDILEQVTDIDSTVTLSSEQNTMPDTFEFENIDISNTTLSTLYSDYGMPFTFSDTNSIGKRVFITYPDSFLQTNSTVYGYNGTYGSLTDFMNDYEDGKTTYGILRNNTGNKLLVFDEDSTSQRLIELNEDGSPTNSFGSFSIQTINSLETLVLDTSQLVGYRQDTAFTVENGVVMYAEYKAANDVYSYILLNREAKDELYGSLSSNPKLAVNVDAGYTYLSLPSSIPLCDIDIQSSLPTICDQNNTLESIFGLNSQIETLYKYSDEWLYWDDLANVNASYMMNKFSIISPLDGILVKASSATTVNIPFDFENESVNDYSGMPVERWFLLSNNKPQTVQEIKAAVEAQGKTLMYIQLLRDDAWYVYAPTNDELVDESISRLSDVNKYESFWIYLK